MSPAITEDPVLVMVEPATIAYGVAAPRLMGVAAATAVSLVKAISVTKTEERRGQRAKAQPNAREMDGAARVSKLKEVWWRKRGTICCGEGTHTTHCSQDRIKFKVIEVENRSVSKNCTVHSYFIHVTI